MPDDLFMSLSIFVSAFGVAAFAGLATLLRFAKKLSKLAVVSAMLNAGFMGLAVALLWYQNYRKAENVYGLMGFCVLAGMGGYTITDILLSLLSGAGIKIIVHHERDVNAKHGDADNESTHP